MKRNPFRWLLATATLCTWLCAGRTIAQPATPASQPAALANVQPQQLIAEAIEVKGLVEKSTVETTTSAPAEPVWTPVQQGDKLGGGTQIRTGLRSYLVLRFGDASVVMIKRSTLASISQFYREADTETVRLGLGYGAIRGGTTEGTVRSDFVVDSTVATLAKRGTEGWEFWVEPYTGRFRVSLAESGLVEALEKLTGQRRLVRPGEYADHSNIGAMWIKQDVFNRVVQFYTAESLTPADVAFGVNNPTGLSVTGPGLGSETRSFSGRPTGPVAPTGPDMGLANQRLNTLLFRPSSLTRPEGNFGLAPTFQVLLPQTQRQAAARPRFRPGR